MLSQVLASDATLGYEEIYNIQVLSFNGTHVANLKCALAPSLARRVELSRCLFCRRGVSGASVWMPVRFDVGMELVWSLFVRFLWSREFWVNVLTC